MTLAVMVQANMNAFKGSIFWDLMPCQFYDNNEFKPAGSTNFVPMMSWKLRSLVATCIFPPSPSSVVCTREKYLLELFQLDFIMISKERTWEDLHARMRLFHHFLFDHVTSSSNYGKNHQFWTKSNSHVPSHELQY